MACGTWLLISMQCNSVVGLWPFSRKVFMAFFACDPCHFESRLATTSTSLSKIEVKVTGREPCGKTNG